MKKAFKIITYCLLVSIIVSIGLCYIIIPERTKSAFDVVVEYLNKPLGVACGVTITVGLVFFVIVKLVYDRHKDSVRKDYENARSYAEQQKDKANGYYEKALKVNEETKALLGGYRGELESLKDLLVKVCNTSPNAKIKALGHDIQNTYEYKKQETLAQVEKCETDIGNFVKEKTNISALEQQVKDLKEKLERLVEQYGKETTND